MAIHAYKEYLDYLNNLNRRRHWPKKLFSILAVIVLFVALTLASSNYYINSKIVPKKQAVNYLNTVKNATTQTARSLNDVTAIYKVAGAKTQAIANANESTPSSLGFNTTIEDIQKSIEGIELARKNIGIQSNYIKAAALPKNLLEISTQSEDYMSSSILVLEKLQSRLAFYKQIQLIIGPNLYLPKLETDNLWGKLTRSQIKDYYQKTADDAQSTIEKLSRISPPTEFKPYFDSQGKYLDLVRDVSENIVRILNTEDNDDINQPTQTEKAYQLFLGASAESKNLKNTIDSEKAIFQSASETVNLLAEVRLKQQSLEMKLNEYTQDAQSKLTNPNSIIENLFLSLMQ